MIKNKGITLIALVITIIVLLILAGVSIALGIGDQGVITKSAKAELEVNKGDVLEQLKVYASELYLHAYSEFGTDYKIKADDYISYLGNKTFTINGKTMDYGEDILKLPKKDGTEISPIDDNKGFFEDNYYWYMIDVSKLDKSPRYGKLDDWTEGDIFLIRRNVTSVNGNNIELGNEFMLAYKRAKDDIVNNDGQEIAIVGHIIDVGNN